MKENIYFVDFTSYKVFSFTDKEMIKAGYEEPITEDFRKEYLKNLIDDLSLNYDDIKILKMEDL